MEGNQRKKTVIYHNKFNITVLSNKTQVIKEGKYLTCISV